MNTVIDSSDRRLADGSEPLQPPAGTVITRLLLAGVALAAGIVGVAMVLVPGSTGRYFSWSLNPPPLAALVGACYIASTLVFGWAAYRERWTGQRGLCVAVLGLAGPTLVATARHRDVFDFDRWQAVAWVLLFIASVTSFGTLVTRRARQQGHGGATLGREAQVVLAVLAGAYGLAAIVLWTDPYWVSAHGPVAAGPLGLRFMGSWAAFLSIGAVYAATHRRWEEARMNVVALVAFPLAALAAALLHAGELRSDMSTVVYLTALALLAALATLVALSIRPVGVSVPDGEAEPRTPAVLLGGISGSD